MLTCNTSLPAELTKLVLLCEDWTVGCCLVTLCKSSFGQACLAVD